MAFPAPCKTLVPLVQAACHRWQLRLQDWGEPQALHRPCTAPSYLCPGVHPTPAYTAAGIKSLVQYGNKRVTHPHGNANEKLQGSLAQVAPGSSLSQCWGAPRPLHSLPCVPTWRWQGLWLCLWSSFTWSGLQTIPVTGCLGTSSGELAQGCCHWKTVLHQEAELLLLLFTRTLVWVLVPCLNLCLTCFLNAGFPKEGDAVQLYVCAGAWAGKQTDRAAFPVATNTLQHWRAWLLKEMPASVIVFTAFCQLVHAALSLTSSTFLYGKDGDAGVATREQEGEGEGTCYSHCASRELGFYHRAQGWLECEGPRRPALTSLKPWHKTYTEIHETESLWTLSCHLQHIGASSCFCCLSWPLAAVPFLCFSKDTSKWACFLSARCMGKLNYFRGGGRVVKYKVCYKADANFCCLIWSWHQNKYCIRVLFASSSLGRFMYLSN